MKASRLSYEDLIIETFSFWTLYLHDKQNYLGRSYIALNRGGNLDPFTETSPEEKSELEAIILKLQTALDKLYQPNLYNYANFRNTWPRCHWHIIPRYETLRVVNGQEFIDRNWGKNYAPYDRDFKVSDALLETIKSSIKQELRAGQ